MSYSTRIQGIGGRNNTADDTNELSGGSIGESTCNEIFKNFVVNFAKECYHECVREPEGEDLLKVMEISMVQNISDESHVANRKNVKFLILYEKDVFS